MKTFVLLIIVLAPSVLTAQPQVPPEEEIVDCTTLKGLSDAIIRNLGANVQCRLERRDLTCVPGTTLAVDVTGDIDLCLSADKRPLTQPYCQSRNSAVYPQKIIERGRFTVDFPDGRSEQLLLDLPFTTTGRKESLAQSQPIERPGPDACVYLQKRILYHPHPRGSRLEPAARPPQRQP